MDSTFTRATLGFMMLTAALTLMALVALWGVDTYAGVNWMAGLVVLIALVAEVGIYSTTLHEPIYKWIREPAEREKNMPSTATEYTDSVMKNHVQRFHNSDAPVRQPGVVRK